MRAALAAALLVAAPAGAQEVVLRDTVLAPGVRALLGAPNGTALVIATSVGAVIVDAQSAAHAQALASAVNMPVRLVISTHYHEDHTGGNALFRARGAAVLAHANVPVEALRDTTIDELEWHREPLPAEALPTVLVHGDTTLVVGGDTIVVLHLAGAHTSGDLAVWVPRANVLHTGDVLEQDAYPFIDWWAGGSLLGTERAVARLLAVTNAATRYVPGHGHVSTRAEVEAYAGMLETVGGRVRTALEAGRSLQDVLDAGLTAEWDEARGARGGRRFVGILFLGLSR